MNFKYGFLALGVSAIFALFGASAHALDLPANEQTTIIVTVRPGDYLSAIAEKYDVTYVELFNANDFIDNPDLIHVGDKIRIPSKNEKLPQRFEQYQQEISNYGTATYAAPLAKTPVQTQAVGYRATTASNTYAWGNCTWYAKNRRSDLPNMLGNGGQWVANAAARGYATGSTPRSGAIAEGPGHVMYVESVHKNGTITVSEMNYNGGLGIVHTRTISANGLRYIY